MTRRSPDQLRTALLRRAVLEHAASERRRSHRPILHVGTPGAAHQVFAITPDEPTDHALRSDIVAAMRAVAARHTGPETMVVWLTRSGPLEPADVDAEWFAAARQAFAEAGAHLVFAVVNRHGWRDPATGATKHWQRPRAGAVG